MLVMNPRVRTSTSYYSWPQLPCWLPGLSGIHGSNDTHGTPKRQMGLSRLPYGRCRTLPTPSPPSRGTRPGQPRVTARWTQDPLCLSHKLHVQTSQEPWGLGPFGRDPEIADILWIIIACRTCCSPRNGLRQRVDLAADCCLDGMDPFSSQPLRVVV